MTSHISVQAAKTEKTIFGLPWAVLFVLLYFVFQTLWVSFVSNGVGVDDAEQLANSSYLDWGYGGSQPPLYTWITSLTTSLLGTSMLTLQLIKFSILASLFISVFAGLRLLGFSQSVASAGMLGLFLIPQIGWESQRALTHSVAGTAACGWVFCAFAWHMRRPSVVSALILGVAMVAAILGKFNASVFVIVVLITGLTIPEYRKILSSRLSVFTFLAFIVSISPTALWMSRHLSNVLERAEKFQIGVAANPLLDRVIGIESLFVAAFLFSILALSAAGIIALIHVKSRTQLQRALLPGEQFMRRIIAVGLLVVLVGVVVVGMTNIKDRWLQPVLFLLPAAIACLFSHYRAESRALKDLAIVGIIAALAVPPILGYYLTYGSSTPPYGQLDFAKLYSDIKSQGDFQTIVTDNTLIGGNFRLFDPELRVIHSETPTDAYKLTLPAVIIWFGDVPADQSIPQLLEGLQIQPPESDYTTTQIHYRTAPDQFMTVSYMLVD